MALAVHLIKCLGAIIGCTEHCVIDVGNLRTLMVALGTILYTPPHQEAPRVSDFPRRQLHTLFDPSHLLYPPFRNLRRLRSARQGGVGDTPAHYRRGSGSPSALARDRKRASLLGISPFLPSPTAVPA